MKICFLTENPFKFGGLERVVSVISNTLAKNGYEVTIMCANSSRLIDRSIYNLDKNISIIMINHEKKGLTHYIKKITNKLLRIINEVTKGFERNTQLLKKIYYLEDIVMIKDIIDKCNKEKYDVVIGVAGYYTAILGIIKEEIHSKVFGWQHSCFEAYFETKRKYYWHQKNLFKEILPLMDKYIVLTNADKIKMDKHFNINSIVIKNPLSFNSEKKTDLKSKFFLSLGRLEEAKGYDLLLESFRLFCKENKDWNLKIIGDGSKKKFIENKIREYHLEKRVMMFPFTKNVADEMTKASIFLFPSRWEGFGLVVIEAFECGLPVISYKLDPLREIITENENGIMVDRFDCKGFSEEMLKLVQDERKMKEMSKKAIQAAKRYSSENIIKDWIQLFQI